MNRAVVHQCEFCDRIFYAEHGNGVHGTRFVYVGEGGKSDGKKDAEKDPPEKFNDALIDRFENYNNKNIDEKLKLVADYKDRNEWSDSDILWYGLKQKLNLNRLFSSLLPVFKDIRGKEFRKEPINDNDKDVERLKRVALFISTKLGIKSTDIPRTLEQNKDEFAFMEKYAPKPKPIPKPNPNNSK